MKGDLTPCVIATEEVAEKYALCGMEILPGILVIPYITEPQAKQDAASVGACFSRINYNGLVYREWR